MNIFVNLSIQIWSAVHITLCLLSVSADLNDACSQKVISRKEAACFAQFNLKDAFLYGLPQPAQLTYFNESMVNLCGNLANIKSCLEAAMSPCRNPYFDFGAYKNTLQKICLHKTLFRESEIFCEMTDVLTTCLMQYHSDVQQLKYHMYLDQSEVSLHGICTVLQKTRKCILINETLNCKREMSDFLTSLYRGRFMPTVCSDNPDDVANGCRRIYFSALFSIILFFFWKYVVFYLK